MLAYVLWACLFIQALITIAILFRFPGFSSAFQRETQWIETLLLPLHHPKPTSVLFCCFSPLPFSQSPLLLPLSSSLLADRQACRLLLPSLHLQMRQVLFLLLCPQYKKKQFNRNHYQFNRKTVLHSKPRIIFFLYRANSLPPLFFFLSRERRIEMKKMEVYSGSESIVYSSATIPSWASTWGFRKVQVPPPADRG